jgi:hypothetical protein
VGLLRKLREWLGGSTDPEARAKAAEIRQDIETIRTGGMSGPANVTHRGKGESTGRP